MVDNINNSINQINELTNELKDTNSKKEKIMLDL